jgi:WD40 repeat protein
LHSFGPFAAPLYALAVTPDGKRFAVSTQDGSIWICDCETGSGLRELSGHTDAVFALAISPDGKHLVSGGQDCTLRNWDLENGREQFRLEGHRDAVYQVNFSASGRRLVSVGASGQVVVWDAGSGVPLFSQRLPGHGFAACFSPDGSRLAAAAGSHFFLLDLPQSAR